MRRWQFPWLAAGVLAVAWAGWHVLGVVLAGLAIGVVYLISLRTHPRVRHAGWFSCHGRGEVPHPLFPWQFRRCGRCDGGRVIRAGAAWLGSDPVRAEYRARREARKRARAEHRWR